MVPSVVPIRPVPVARISMVPPVVLMPNDPLSPRVAIIIPVVPSVAKMHPVPVVPILMVLPVVPKYSLCGYIIGSAIYISL